MPTRLAPKVSRRLTVGDDLEDEEDWSSNAFVPTNSLLSFDDWFSSQEGCRWFNSLNLNNIEVPRRFYWNPQLKVEKIEF